MRKLRLTATKVDLGRGVVDRYAGGTERLTTREAELLTYLAERPGQLVTREELLREVWGYGDDVVSRTADNTVRRLRTKIEADPAAPDHVVTVFGEGYRFVSLADPTLPPQPPPQRLEASIPPPSRPPAESNVSAPPEGFVGRRAEAAAMEAWWASPGRLLTLLGPAGAGKTSLSHRFAWDRRADLPGGSWRCDLARARTSTDVALVIASARGLHLASDDDPVGALGDALAAAPPALLVLDNFEGVVDSTVPAVAAWLAAAPDLRIVVTSQARLRAAGEEVVEVGALTADDGLALFENRARQANPKFFVTADTEPAVRALVEALDGLPLGIELAAARMDVLSPAALLERLHQRFAVLNRPRRDGASRHATLSAAIEGSWSLLQPGEQAALAQSSVFAGSFDLEAIEAVLDLPEDLFPLDVVSTLRERSLLKRVEDDDGHTRFAHFESVRAFAETQLDDGGAAAARHAKFYVERGTALASRIKHVGGGAWVRQLGREIANLGAIAERYAESDPALACQAIAAQHAYLRIRGPAALHREVLSRGIEVAAAAGDEALQLELLEDLAWAELRAGRMEEAAATLARAKGLPGGSLHPGIRLAEGSAAARDGRFDESERHFTAAWQLTQGRGDDRTTARVLAGRGRAHLLNFRVDEAEELLEQAMGRFRELGDRGREARCLDDLARVLLSRHDLDTAAQYNLWAAEIHDELGADWELALDLFHGGIIATHDGRLDDAATMLRRAVEIGERIGHEPVVRGARSRLEDLTPDA